MIPCGMRVPVAVWQRCELLYTCYFTCYLLKFFLGVLFSNAHRNLQHSAACVLTTRCVTSSARCRLKPVFGHGCYFFFYRETMICRSHANLVNIDNVHARPAVVTIDTRRECGARLQILRKSTAERSPSSKHTRSLNT